MYVLIIIGGDSHDVYYVSSILGGLSLDRFGGHALQFFDLESCQRVMRYIYKEYFLHVSEIYVPYLCPQMEVSND